MENRFEFLDREHAELMGSLRKLARSGKKTGASVTDLLAVLEPHFAKEERLIMPMLFLANRLAEGEHVKADSVPAAAHEIEAEYSIMFNEHARIRELAAYARAAAKKEKNSIAAETLDWLSHHAEIEEAIVYPLALLAAKLVKFTV